MINLLSGCLLMVLAVGFLILAAVIAIWFFLATALMLWSMMGWALWVLGAMVLLMTLCALLMR